MSVALVFATSVSSYVLPPVASRCGSRSANATAATPIRPPTRSPPGREGLSLQLAMCAVPSPEASKPPETGGELPRVTSVRRYPVKGGRAELQREATLSKEGLVGDRRFMVTTAAGDAVTQRQNPALATLLARLDDASQQIHLRAAHGALNVSIRRGGKVDATLFGARLAL